MQDSQPRKELASWLRQALTEAPSEVSLLYVEWNEGWINGNSQGNAPLSMLFTLAGYTWPEKENFDPEDPGHLEILAEEPNFEVQACAIPKESLEEDEIYEFFEKAAKSPKLKQLLGGRTLAYGEHEGTVRVLYPRPSLNRLAPQRYFYELHVRSLKNDIESYYKAETFNERPLLDHDYISTWEEGQIKLFLQRRAKLLDFLYFYRGWLVCSKRAVQLFQGATEKVQVFSAPLFDGPDGKQVDGYFIVNLYEKLNCLYEKDVLPPITPGGRRTFDPAKGYTINLSSVEERAVFRINYEYYRLLVSQEFRDKLEHERITGLEWLRRSSV